MTTTLTPAARDALARWSDPERRPLFKGRLFDREAWASAGGGGAGVASGCACAQGDVLLHNGFGPDDLMAMDQLRADEEVAKLLGISVTHSILLRQVNDSADGCPQDVLSNPEKLLGAQAPVILAFWRHLDRMTDQQWRAARAARAAWAARAARAARAAWAAWAAWAARDIVYCVLAEIAGTKWRPEHEQGEYVFLPMFGFADPQAVLDVDSAASSSAQ
ncbi:MAG: hypothetical protein QOH86_2249 [Sphingomonadales bacterium]|nr:hypothetical protein [Sphingomonadales bacterium]